MTKYEDSAKTIAMTIIGITFIIVMAIILAGCGKVNVIKHADGSYEASTISLFKNIESVSIEKDNEGNVNASLGSSVNTEEANALALVCIINPNLSVCQNDA